MKLPQGFSLSAIHCGIKKKKLDLGLIASDKAFSALGFFTTNANLAYSVTFSKKNINNPIKALLVNSGNANCFTHKKGLKDTEEIASKLAKLLKVKTKNILFASTGIIGKKLPKEKIKKNLPCLLGNLSKGVKDFSLSILTTDTFPKIAYASAPLKKGKLNIIGFAKGAGMIHPNLATMLAFILTDAKLPSALFKKIAKDAISESFNSISVDGCMSTNDSVFFLSSSKKSLKSKKELNLFSKKLKDLCLLLAKMIVKDAEGATKFIELQVKGAKTPQEAKKACVSIANSSLFKSALYGANSNWGRIISALGQVGIKVKENVSVKAQGLKSRNVKIIVDLKGGNFGYKFYTSDLTPEYVKINAQYS